MADVPAAEFAAVLGRLVGDTAERSSALHLAGAKERLDRVGELFCRSRDYDVPVVYAELYAAYVALMAAYSFAEIGGKVSALMTTGEAPSDG